MSHSHNAHGAGRFTGGVSSSVSAGPSRSNAVKGLSSAYSALGATAAAAGTNRYKYRGFNARIQGIAISFRTLLEPHERSAEDQLAAARVEAAGMFAAAGTAAAAAASSEAFSSAELSTQDARAAHSYFLASLESFSQTNLHVHFLTFLSEVRGLVASFPLLLRNKTRVVDILLKHAAVPDSHAQKELFSLMSVLARDLRGEFVPFFGVVMRALLSLLNPSDAANIQAIFQTLASLFKYTARQLAEKVDVVFEEYFSELVGHHKSYIRHFSAQSLAFLLRVAQRNGHAPDAAFTAMLALRPERDNDAFKDGIAATLFETMKNISFQFQAKHVDHVRALLKPLRAQGAQGEHATDILLRLHRRMANYTRREYCGSIWTLLVDRLQKLQETLVKEKPTESESPQSLARLAEATRILQIIELWMSHRGGSRLPSSDVATRCLSLAFGPLFARSNARVEWKRTAASMLLKYWKNAPSNFATLVAPRLETLLSLPMSATVSGAEGELASVDDLGIENATLLLSFLEAARDLQQSASGVLATLVRRLTPAIEALLLAPTVTPVLQGTARALGLALLLELNGAQPMGAPYAVTPLEELQRSAPNAAARRAARRRRQIDADAGDDAEEEAPAEEDMMDLDEAADEAEAAEEAEEEEEVDPESYATPLAQPTLFACSTYMCQLLRLTPRLQSCLLAHVAAALDEGHLTESSVAAASADATSGTSLLLGSSTLAARLSALWAALQLLPASGIDVSSPVRHYLPETKHDASVADLLQSLITAISSRVNAATSTVFNASTPVDASVNGDSTAGETNNHLLMARAAHDQLVFLRAQTSIALAQMIKVRFSCASHEDLGRPPVTPRHAAFDLLGCLRAFLPTTLEAFRAAPTHVANVVALDRAFEMAKSLQIGGVAEEAVATPAPEAAKTPSKKKKGAAAAAATTTVTVTNGSAELTAFLRMLFSSGSFSALSGSFLPNLSAAHAFLRAATLSVMRYFTPLRFAADGADQAAAAAAAQKRADDGESIDLGAVGSAGNRSELVGDCPLLSIMHDISLLAPTLDYEKEYIRLLKKIEVLVNSGRMPDAYMRLVPAFLLGLLHLKLNPLWTVVQKVLCSSFVNRYAVTPEKQRWLWEAVILVKVNEIKARTQLILKDESVAVDEEDTKMETDDEQLFAKHHARTSSTPAATTITSTACVPSHSPVLIRFSHFVSLTSRSTDSFTYQSLLYAAFALETSGSSAAAVSAVTNGFARRLFDKTFVQQACIDDFLSDVWRREFLVAFPNTMRVEEGINEQADAANDNGMSDEELAEDADDLAFYDRASSTASLPVPVGYTLRVGARKLVKQKLLLFLKMFLQCFHKAAKLPRANELRNVLFTLLANSEEEVQRLSLACLTKYQLPYLTPYVSTLQGLISEAKWRETMTGFSLAPESGLVAPEHRAHFAAVLVRILYPRLTQRQTGKASRATGLAQRRAAVLGFLGGLSHEELQHLVSMVMGGAFRKVVNVVVRAAADSERREAGRAVAPTPSTPQADLTFEQILQHQIPALELGHASRALEQGLLDPRLYATNSSLLIPTSKQIGFLHMLQFFLAKLRSLSIPYLKFFMLQCTYMVINVEVQIERRKGQIVAQEAEAAAAAEAEVEAKAGDVEKAAKEGEDEDDVDVDVDDDEEDDNADAEDADEDAAPEDDQKKQKSSTDEDDLALPDLDDDAEILPGGKSPKKKTQTTPYALQKYLAELREIRQLAFSRMSTILEQYPHVFRPSGPAQDLPVPKGLPEEQRTVKHVGAPLTPYLQFFLAVAFPSVTRLASEGTQHMGGLWSCMVHLASHPFLLVHFLAPDLRVLRVAWNDSTQKRGLGLTLESARKLLAAPQYPLFAVLLDSVGARSVHQTVVGAVLSVSESILRAGDDAAEWAASKQEMDELEAERAEKTAVRDQHRRARLAARKKAALAAGRAFDADESSEDDEEDDDNARLLVRRIVQIDTLVLSPTSHAERSRQYWFSQHVEALRDLWQTHVDKYLAQMHRWIAHLAAIHRASNGRKLAVTGSQKETAAVTKAAAARKSNGPRQTFFPRRELEVLSQIAGFATSAATASSLVALLVPFAHSPEKGHLLLHFGGARGLAAANTRRGRGVQSDRARRPAPTLHHTLLRIFIALSPLLPSGDVETLLDHMQRLLFSLKGHAHRALLSELYGLLADQPVAAEPAFTYLPALARTLQAMNALDERRIEEYDDHRRLEAYAALEAAFGRATIAREMTLIEQRREEVAMDEAALAVLDARREELRGQSDEIARQIASSAVTAESTTPAAARLTFEMFDNFFTDYFSTGDAAYARALATLRPLLHNLAYDLLDDDLGTRSSAASMLKRVVAFLSLPHPHAPDESGLVHIDTAPFLPRYGRLQTPSSLLSGLLYPLLKRAIKNPVDKIRREVVLLLREMIVTFPRFYRSFLVLVDTDLEKDFLENVVSIQLHARRRAIVRLFQKVTIQDTTDPNMFHAHPSKAVDLQTIQHILLPLLHHFIYDPASSQSVNGAAAVMSAGAHSGTMSNAKQAQRAGAEGTLLEEALKLAGKLSAYMPWASWFHQVQAYLKLMTAKPVLERTLVRLVCAYVREWHFEVEETPEERQLAREAVLRRERDERKAARQAEEEREARERTLRGEDGRYQETAARDTDDVPMEDAAAAAAEPVSEASALSQRIRATLSKRLLPQLHGLLTGHKVKAAKKGGPTKGMLTTYENQNELTSMSGMAGGDGSRDSGTLELVRVPVAMAMVALLRQLPQAIFHEEFPRLLTKLCVQLQHREQQARDLTRSTLIDILHQLGPFYFHFFVEELSRHLTNGYQVHVLGHMLWACLDTLVNKLKVAPGSIDHSLTKLMDLCMNDLLGEPARQKEVPAIRAATKEARINHAPDCFQMLAQVISFPGSIHYLIDPFRFKLAHDSTLRLKELGIIADTLKRISIGLHANASVQARIPDLLVYIHTYLFRNATESFAALFPVQASGKMGKAEKKATAANKNRYRKLDLAPERTPMEALREENKARSEGRNVGGGLAQRKALEFVLAMQSSEAGTSAFERTRAKAKPSKDETYLLVQPAPPRDSFEVNSVAKGHHSNLILVFGLNLLYYTLKHRKLDTGANAAPGVSVETARQSLSQVALDNLARLDPFLQLIRDYCLVMGSDLAKDAQAATRSTVTKDGQKQSKTVTIATSSTAVITVALKCSEYLLPMVGLPSLSAYLRDLCNYMFGLIHSKSSPAVLSVCYRNLASVLRVADWRACGISPEKQKLMLHFIKSEVLAPHVTAATAVAFKLLQAMLARTIELEELYDFIIVVSQLMVTSEVADVQKQCASAVYTFLFNYKLGAGRMQTHFGFLLNQLSYPHATGRAAVLQLLQTIFTHFHPSVLEEQLEFLFLPLVVHLVNETTAANKKLSHDVIAALIAKISPAKQAEVMKIVYGWWKEDVPKKNGKNAATETAAAGVVAPRSQQSQLLQFASLHIICIMIDLLKSQYTSQLYLTRTLGGLTAIMREKLAEQEAREAQEEADADEHADSEGDDASASWRVLYSSLLAFEKLFKNLPPAVLAAQLSQAHDAFFADLLRCLLYPHAWVRTVAGRIVGFVLAGIPLTSFNSVSARDVLASSLVQSPSNLFRLMKSSASQLQSPHLSETLAEQIVKNLVWISVAAHNIGGGNIWENLDGEEKADEEAEQAEGEAEVDGDADADQDAEEDADDDVDMNGAEEESTSPVAAATPKKATKASAQTFAKSDNRILNWLFTRLSYMCKRDDGIRMRESIFRYFATMSSQLPVGVFSCFLLQVLHPLYRLASAPGRAEEAELKEFAESVLDLIQSAVGTPAFLAAYNTIRARRQAVRTARHSKRAALAITRPEVHAQRKQAKHEQKRVAKKRKIQQLKSGRGRPIVNTQATMGQGEAVETKMTKKRQRT